MKTHSFLKASEKAIKGLELNSFSVSSSPEDDDDSDDTDDCLTTGDDSGVVLSSANSSSRLSADWMS